LPSPWGISRLQAGEDVKLDNTGVFIGAGLAIGVALGLIWDGSQRRKNNDDVE
jgi:hypothetical protein